MESLFQGIQLRIILIAWLGDVRTHLHKRRTELELEAISARLSRGSGTGTMGMGRELVLRRGARLDLGRLQREVRGIKVVGAM